MAPKCFITMGLKKAKLDVVTPEVGAKTFNDFEIDERLLKTVSGESKGPFALFIAPTKELCVQINDLLLKLLQPLPFLRSLNLADLTSDERSVWENDTANFVVSTPGKILEVLAVRRHFCEDVRHLVLDEADLLLSFGYEDEMRYA
ncbi:hypothetical protein COOONC_08428 [Cooperia oncophora]